MAADELVLFRPRALLFDMDGTLVDSSPNVARAYRWWAERHGLPADPILAIQTGRPHREVMAQFGAGLDLQVESDLFTDFEVRDEEGMPLIPGAREILAIAEQGRWAVVTSAKRPLAEMRFRVNRLTLPDVVVTADMVSRGKPDPECYLLAARLLDVTPKDCLIFEDAPAGVESAKRAGIPVIGISPSGQLVGADLAIRDFRDIDVRHDAEDRFSIQRVSLDS